MDRRDGETADLVWSLDLYASLGVPVERTILGLPLYGMRWRVAGPELGAERLGDGAIWVPADNPNFLANPPAPPQLDPIEVVEFYAVAPTVSPVPGDSRATAGWQAIYVDSPQTLTPKLALADDRGLAGGGFWAIGYERGLPDYTALIARFAAGKLRSPGVTGSGRRHDHDLRVGPVRDEGEQAHRLVLKGGTLGRGDRFERGDGDRGAMAVTVDPPLAAEHAVEEDRASRSAVAGRKRDAPARRDDPGPVRVSEQDVVVFGQEPRRSRHVGAGSRRVDEVEQLAVPLVPEGRQPGPEPLDDGPQPGKAGPGLDVHDRRRAERGQVAEDELVDGRVGLRRPAEPAAPSSSRPADRSSPRHRAVGPGRMGRGR